MAHVPEDWRELICGGFARGTRPMFRWLRGAKYIRRFPRREIIRDTVDYHSAITASLQAGVMCDGLTRSLTIEGSFWTPLRRSEARALDRLDVPWLPATGGQPSSLPGEAHAAAAWLSNHLTEVRVYKTHSSQAKTRLCTLAPETSGSTGAQAQDGT